MVVSFSMHMAVSFTSTRRERIRLCGRRWAVVRVGRNGDKTHSRFMHHFFWRFVVTISCALIVSACSSASAPGSGNVDNPASGPDTVERALIDLTGTYRGFRGGLYPNGSNSIPTTHASAGSSRAKNIRPLDVNGNPAATGKYVLLSVGMSNTAQEFCGGDMTTGCASETFMGQAASDPQVNKSALVIVNGAQGGRDAT